MENKNITKLETFFYGSKEKWLSVLSENSVNNIIKILGVDLDKEALWNELSIIIRVWGEPSASKMGINLKLLRDEAANMENTLLKALKLLDGLNYESLFAKGTITKEFEIARKIRQKSKKGKSDKHQNVSDLYIKQEYDESGNWGKYCLFDYELPEAIKVLGKIHSYINDAKNDFAADVKGRGKQNIMNIKQDTLVFEICKIYKKYKGKAPNFSTTGARVENPNKVYGDIIALLKIILSSTSFKRETSDGALEKRLRALRKKPEYKWLWEDSEGDSKK